MVGWLLNLRPAASRREEMRAAGRSDLENACQSHGGVTAVGIALGWSRAQARPKGFWNDLGNIRSEIDTFVQSNGLDPGVMPGKRDLLRAGRYDRSRAVEGNRQPGRTLRGRGGCYGSCGETSPALPLPPVAGRISRGPSSAWAASPSSAGPWDSS